jgi:hypothetical protein
MEKLAFFLGKWRGKGTVLDKNLEYLEELTFILLRSEPVAVINVQSFTKDAVSGDPLHAENGFFKLLPPKEQQAATRPVEAMLSHPFGLNEFEYGTYSAEKLELEASKAEHFQRGMTAKGK